MRRNMQCLAPVCCNLLYTTFWVLSSALNHVTDAVSINGIWPDENTIDWYGANKLCQQEGGDLVTIANDDVLQNITQTLHSNSTYWIGGLIKQGGWMWAKDSKYITQSPLGCFNITDDLLRLEVTYPHNQAQTCINWCKNKMKRDYAILQNDTCWCMYDIFNFMAVNESQCNVACPGDRRQPCGGSMAYTIYKATVHVRWANLGPPSVMKKLDCASILMWNTGELHWYADNCALFCHYLCRHDDSESCSRVNQPAPCTIKSKLEARWQQAAAKCEEDGGYLDEFGLNEGKAYVTSSDLHCTWTGLTRSNAIWSDGSHIVFDPVVDLEETRNESQLCLSLSVGGGGGKIAGRPCSGLARPLCYSGPKTSTEPYSSGEYYSTGSRIESDDGLYRQMALLPTAPRLYKVYIYAAVGACIAVITILITIVVVRKRRRSSHDRNEQTHFYFVLDPDMVKMESAVRNRPPDKPPRRHVQDYYTPPSEIQPRTNDSTYDVIAFNKKPQASNCTTNNGKQNSYDRLTFASSGYDVLNNRRRPKHCCDNTYSLVNRVETSSENVNSAEDPGESNVFTDRILTDKNRLSGGVPGTTRGKEEHVYDQCHFRHSLDASSSIANRGAMPTPPVSAGNTLNRKSHLGYSDPYDERLYESLRSLNLDKTTSNSSNTKLHNSDGKSQTNIYSTLADD